MTYIIQTWLSGAAGNTPVTAGRMNHIEAGILAASQGVDTLNIRADGIDTELVNMSDLIDGIIAGGTGGGTDDTAAIAALDGRITTTENNITTLQGNYTSVASSVSSLTTTVNGQTTSISTLNTTKAPIASPTFTGTVGGITKSMVGLSAVDNTADTAKPVSTAQAAAIALKANLASPTFTGTVNGITKAMVGLGNVDNTSDLVKFSLYGVRPTLYYNGTAWPTRTVPTGYTGSVHWFSAFNTGAAAPAAALNGDTWERVIA